MIRTQLARIRSASSFFFSGSIAAAVCVTLSQLSFASPLTIPSGDVVFRVTGGQTPGSGRTEEYHATVQSDGSFLLQHQATPTHPTGWDLTQLSFVGNVDPFTSVNYAITNSAAVPLSFTVSVLSPISPQGPFTLHGGSMGATLTDSNNSGTGSVSTVPGVPYYQGQIDGATVLSIYSDPYSLGIAFPGQSIQVPSLNPGLPGPTLPSGPALSTIGIINQFTLSPGDMISGNSFFSIVSVPEPGTLILLALSALALPGRRRS